MLSNSWTLSNSEYKPTYHETCILPWSYEYYQTPECSQTLNTRQLITRLAYNHCPGVLNVLKLWILANLPQDLHTATALELWMLSNSEYSLTYHKTCIQPLSWSFECSQTLNTHLLITRLAYNHYPGVLNAHKHIFGWLMQQYCYFHMYSLKSQICIVWQGNSRSAIDELHHDIRSSSFKVSFLLTFVCANRFVFRTKNPWMLTAQDSSPVPQARVGAGVTCWGATGTGGLTAEGAVTATRAPQQFLIHLVCLYLEMEVLFLTILTVIRLLNHR